MLDKAISTSPRCHRFLNTSTGESIRMDLPELADHRFLALTPECLLLLLHEPTLVIRLLNPLTRQLINLPPITKLLTREERRAWRLDHAFAVDLRVDGDGIVADASMVVVKFGSLTGLAVAKPGSENWTVVKVKGRHITSTVMFAGRFYCSTCRAVMMLDTSRADQTPRLRAAVKWSWSLINFIQMSDSLRLVDNGGELLLVHRMVRPNMDPHKSYKCEVYRVDLNAGSLIPVKSLNGRAVFMGRCRAFSISAEPFPSLTTLDTLYLGTDYYQKRRMVGYNIANGSNVLRHEDWWVEPCTLVDCLSSCIAGSGEQLV
ncbi:hypothetical protein QOZ80_7AG0573770 [Eleusine coracana subsp. coracana]|nr:hypothetical protein QOZ80_7AG0573770 [Eleusine coracana subsp. coracana]